MKIFYQAKTQHAWELKEFTNINDAINYEKSFKEQFNPIESRIINDLDQVYMNGGFQTCNSFVSIPCNPINTKTIVEEIKEYITLSSTWFKNYSEDYESMIQKSGGQLINCQDGRFDVFFKACQQSSSNIHFPNPFSWIVSKIEEILDNLAVNGNAPVWCLYEANRKLSLLAISSPGINQQQMLSNLSRFKKSFAIFV